MNKIEIRLFHTGSLVEFHEFNLRLLLHKYVSSLTFYEDNKEENILNSDKCFSTAVQKYKNIVTHYMGSKFEIWNAFVMKPVFGLNDGMVTHEFAKSRGALHYHSLFNTITEVDNHISQLLNNLAEGIHKGMNLINDFIIKYYNPNIHSKEFPLCPAYNITKDSMDERKRFMYLIEGGQMLYDEFPSTMDELKRETGEVIGIRLQLEYGFNTMHEGRFPQDWVKPGGLSCDVYKETCKNMLFS